MNSHALINALLLLILLTGCTPQQAPPVQPEVPVPEKIEEEPVQAVAPKEPEPAAVQEPKDYLSFDPHTNKANLFDGSALGQWKETDFTGRSDVYVKDNAIYMPKGNDMTGITWSGPLIRMDYEISVYAMRVEGSDFFCGLTFPVKDDSCTLVVGGWGGMVVGLSTIDFYDAVNNETATGMQFDTGKWYNIRVRVTADKIQAWIDDDLLVNLKTTGRKIGVRWEVEKSMPLGIATWQTTGAAKNITIYRVDGPIPTPEDEYY